MLTAVADANEFLAASIKARPSRANQIKVVTAPVFMPPHIKSPAQVRREVETEMLEFLHARASRHRTMKADTPEDKRLSAVLNNEILFVIDKIENRDYK